MGTTKRIADIREAKGLKQADIAEKLHIDQSTYSRLEKRGDKISLEQLKQIADALEVDLQTLLGIEESGNSKAEIEELKSELVRLKEYQKQLSSHYKPYMVILSNLFYATIFEESKALGYVPSEEIFDLEKGTQLLGKLNEEQRTALFKEKLKKIPFMLQSIINTDLAPEFKDIALKELQRD